MKFGDKVEQSAITQGAPPIVIQLQPTGYVKLNTPDGVKNFETMMHALYGHKLPIHQGLNGCETCSGGCTDDCGFY